MTVKAKSYKDTLIIVAVVVVAAAGYFWYTRPAKTASSQFKHPEVAGMDSKMMGASLNLPVDYESLVALGNQSMDQGNFPLAAESYRRALTIKSDDPDIRTDYGACLHGMGLPHRALEEFRKVLKAHPNHGVANFNMGIVFYNEQVLDSARVYWEKYLQIEPEGNVAATVREFLAKMGG